MKKICIALVYLFLFGCMLSPTVYAQQQRYNPNIPAEKEDNTKWDFSDNPSALLRKVYREANEENNTKVQATKLDSVTSKHCDELSVEDNFTISKTLCSIKYSIRSYLQYIMYIWLVAATIFIIRNGFKIVTATDKEAQIKKFTSNMLHLAIWVILLTSFYFILEAFVSVVNFIVGDQS